MMVNVDSMRCGAMSMLVEVTRSDLCEVMSVKNCDLFEFIKWFIANEKGCVLFYFLIR